MRNRGKVKAGTISKGEPGTHKPLAASSMLAGFKEGLRALKAVRLPAEAEKKILGENAVRLLELA
jgi:hypothetical protein